MPNPLKSVVIVGRPNVGKSTLFNAIIGDRRSIVGDEPGITRDRIYGEAEHNGKHFQLVDTGGIVANDPDLIPSEILRQARMALDEAAHIIFLVDGRTELTAPDRELAQLLRKLGKPVTVAVNKIDVPKREILAQEFYELGFEELFPVSAEHRLGIGELLDHVTKDFPVSEEPAREQPRRIKVAIIGRPNVGKSTLLNALVGSERTIVSPVPGTTRDAVDESVVRGGTEYIFVDTAGIRRKGKTNQMAEKLSVVMARRHIGLADVVLVVLDATDGAVSQDATIAGYAHESGSTSIVCVNKWDIVPSKDKGAFVESIRTDMKFLEYAPIAFLSAVHGSGIAQLFGLIERGYEASSKRITTGELNRFLESLKLDMNLKVKYMTQAAVRPPTFVVFSEGTQKLHFSKERYLANQLRKRFGFEGAPIVVKTKLKQRRAG